MPISIRVQIFTEGIPSFDMPFGIQSVPSSEGNACLPCTFEVHQFGLYSPEIIVLAALWWFDCAEGRSLFLHCAELAACALRHPPAEVHLDAAPQNQDQF